MRAKREEEDRREAERKADADRRAADEAERRRLAEEAQRPREVPQPVAVAAVDEAADDGPNEAVIERLRAYTDHMDAVTADPPPQ